MASSSSNPSAPLPIGVLVSGTGSNLQVLLDELHPDVVEVVGVASSRADAYALERAAAAGIPTATFDIRDHADRAARDAEMATWMIGRGAALIVCAGFMWLLTDAFRERFPGRVINLHPSLLPAFPGRHAMEDALAAGVRETGVSIFVVDEGVDTGPVLAQERIPVEYDDRLATLRARIQAVEHRLLPETIRAIAEGRISL
ncbi:MAG TPA: phosphoribosylglycinamide formyltransferase [Gaiellales bacterium]|jgi:phosphoribosylglycinamide formyltransferase-1